MTCITTQSLLVLLLLLNHVMCACFSSAWWIMSYLATSCPWVVFWVEVLSYPEHWHFDTRLIWTHTHTNCACISLRVYVCMIEGKFAAVYQGRLDSSNDCIHTVAVKVFQYKATIQVHRSVCHFNKYLWLLLL